MIDGVSGGEVRSEKGQEGPFRQLDDSFACVRPRGKPHGDLFGVRVDLSAPQGWRTSQNGKTAAEFRFAFL